VQPVRTSIATGGASASNTTRNGGAVVSRLDMSTLEAMRARHRRTHVPADADRSEPVRAGAAIEGMEQKTFAREFS